MLSVFAYKHLKQQVQHVVSLFKMVTGLSGRYRGNDIMMLSSELLIHPWPSALPAEMLNTEACSWCHDQFGWKWWI